MTPVATLLRKAISHNNFATLGYFAKDGCFAGEGNFTAEGNVAEDGHWLPPLPREESLPRKTTSA
jgi:hypothetical protein